MVLINNFKFYSEFQIFDLKIHFKFNNNKFNLLFFLKAIYFPILINEFILIFIQYAINQILINLIVSNVSVGIIFFLIQYCLKAHERFNI